MLSKVSPQIVLSPRNRTVPEGNTTHFLCKATGFPKPTVAWTFNDGNLPSFAFEKHTEEGSHLLLKNVTKDMEGTYRCRAENKANATSSTSTLLVLGKYLSLLPPETLGTRLVSIIHNNDRLNEVEKRFEILAITFKSLFWRRVLHDVYLCREL